MTASVQIRENRINLPAYDTPFGDPKRIPLFAYGPGLSPAPPEKPTGTIREVATLQIHMQFKSTTRVHFLGYILPKHAAAAGASRSGATRHHGTHLRLALLAQQRGRQGPGVNASCAATYDIPVSPVSHM